MYFRPPHCPNPACACHVAPPPDFFINRGSYTTKHDRQKVPRYRCKTCRKTFSSRRFSATAGQHKPAVNAPLAKLLSSSVTQRRCGQLLGIAKLTVARKFAFLARLARKAHADFLASGQIKSSYVQFDEMETFVATKLKPLSIALAVRARTGQIIGARVAAMNCHGRMAGVSQHFYGLRKDTRERACTNLLKVVNAVAKKQITVATDGKVAYGPLIKKVVPQATHKVVVGGRKKVRGAPDPLFRLNHTCAKIRADLSRMARRTWATTKRLWALQYHLDLYIAFNNGYELG